MENYLNSLPLDGIRVLDLTNVVAGPITTLYLAMMGAEVVKIENPKENGDVNRSTPPIRNHVSVRFCTLNHNKQSMLLDLSTSLGKKVFLSLVKKSDIVVDNFRHGVMDKLGIGFNAMLAVNPKIVYGHITGFGSSGKYKDLPAYDVIAQALSGLAWLNGEEGDPPVKVGTSIGDVIAGINLVAGVLAALRQSEQSGKGQEVEVPLVNSLISSLIVENVSYLYDGTIPKRMGNQYREWCPYGIYPAKDGYYALGIGTEKNFSDFMAHVVKRPEWVNDQRFSSHGQRVKYRKELDFIINDWAKDLSVSAICEELTRQGIPCAPVNNIRDVVSDEQFSKDGNMFPEYEQPEAGRIRVTNIPIQFHTAADFRFQPAPALGSDTEQLLRSLPDLSEEEIQSVLHPDIPNKAECSSQKKMSIC